MQKTKIDMDENKITFIRKQQSHAIDSYSCSGALPNDKITTLRVKTVKQYDKYNNWSAVSCFLIGSSINKSKYRSYETHLKNKEDNIPAYGVYHHSNFPCNLKIRKPSSKELTLKDDIKIIFDPINS